MCNIFRKSKKRNYGLDELNTTENEILSQNTEECAICLEYLNREFCIITNCNHFFHKKCIENYIEYKVSKTSNQFNCPYCNKFQFFVTE